MTLTGIWTRQTQSDCAGRYPAQIEFKANNLYEAQADANATLHPVWDVGTWSAEGNQLKVSTSTDARVTYTASLKDNVLTIKDPDGCTLEYRKK